MPRKKNREEEENLERWLVSYADFMTLLFAFFVVMYAISSVNEGKYRVLSDTLISAFKNPPKTLKPIQVGSEGVTGDPSVLKKDKRAPGTPDPIKLMQQGPNKVPLEQIASEFRRVLMPLMEQNLISIDENEYWVEIEINNSLLFSSGSATLDETAIPVLQKLASILSRYPNQIQVEGFTDNFPINTVAFPSNWELSAARAASVVHVFNQQGVEPARMAAVGYGEFRPVADNATPEGRSRNRRVVLVVLADEKARRLLDMQRNASTRAKAPKPAESTKPVSRTPIVPEVITEIQR